MYTKFLKAAERIVAEYKAQYVGVYMMFGGGSGGGTTTSNSTTQPWAGQEPYLSQQYGAAAAMYNTPGNYPQYFPGAAQGSEISPLNSAQNTALTGIQNTGMNSPLLNQDAQTQQNILSGQFLNAGNPYEQGMFNAINAQITPQIEAQFTQGNAMNNPAAAYATAQGVGSADAQVANANYNTALQQMTQESLYAPNTYSTQLQGQNAALTAGNQQQQQSQNVLNNQINAYNYNQTLPYQMLNQFAASIAGNPGSSTTQTQPYYNNNTQNTLSTLGSLGSLAYLALA